LLRSLSAIVNGAGLAQPLDFLHSGKALAAKSKKIFSDLFLTFSSE
jgi:hypothetical protein